MQYALGWSEKINHEAKIAQEVVYTIRRAEDTDEIAEPQQNKTTEVILFDIET